jgi:hypothetical protein
LIGPSTQDLVTGVALGVDVELDAEDDKLTIVEGVDDVILDDKSMLSDGELLNIKPVVVEGLAMEIELLLDIAGATSGHSFK